MKSENDIYKKESAWEACLKIGNATLFVDWISLSDDIVNFINIKYLYKRLWCSSIEDMVEIYGLELNMEYSRKDVIVSCLVNVY